MKDLLQHVIHQLDRIEDKLSSTDDKLDAVDKTLIKQEKNLEEHMRRTELLEIEQKEFRSDLSELEKTKIQIKAIVKFTIKAAPIVCAIAAGIYKYLV